MHLSYTHHWLQKRVKRRQDITDDLIEYCLTHSAILRDRTHEDVYNAITPIPPSNRKLKVVYQRKGKTIRILTAYWID